MTSIAWVPIDPVDPSRTTVLWLTRPSSRVVAGSPHAWSHRERRLRPGVRHTTARPRLRAHLPARARLLPAPGADELGGRELGTHPPRVDLQRVEDAHQGRAARRDREPVR